MNRLPSTVRQLIAALRGLLIFTVICGIIYPVVMFGIAQVAFHNQANGSLVSYHGRVVGSSLLCQEFTDAKGNPLPQYFQPRPSTAANADVKTDYGCDPLFSGGVQPGPEQPGAGAGHQAAAEADRGVRPRQDLADPAGRGDDIGLGPGPLHLAAERRHPGGPRGGGPARQPGRDQGAGQQNTKGRTLGFLGEPRVNVLTLNIALDQKYPVCPGARRRAR